MDCILLSLVMQPNVLQIGLSYKMDYTFKDLTYHYIFSHTQLGFAMSVACG